MRILIVVSTLNTGGAQRAAANLSLGLSKYCDIDFLLNEASDITYSYEGNIIDLGVTPVVDRLNLKYQTGVFFKRFAVLRRLKRSQKYDAVCSFLDSANIVNILTGKKYCKTIVSVHSVLSGTKVIKEYRHIVLPLVKLLYRHADRIVAVSRYVKDDLEKKIGLNGNNIVMIHNGFAVEEIRSKGSFPIEEDEKKLFERSFTIIAAGRLNWWKGFSHLIRAMKQVCKSIPDCMLVILGEGEERDALQNTIDELNLGNNVILKGFSDNPFMYIKRADVFVLSSIDEALPSVLIESLILSVPCVATDLPGSREILAPNTAMPDELNDSFMEVQYGILTPALGNQKKRLTDILTPEEILMAKAICYLHDNRKAINKFRIASREIQERYNIDTMATEWMNVIV